MKLYKIYLLITINLSNYLAAQVVNIDREIKDDSITRKWEFVGAFDLSSNKQKNNILNFNTNIEIERNFNNHYVLIGIFKNASVFSGNASIQNEGMYHLRFRDRNFRKLSFEPFLQYQWNGIWGMDYRYLSGANLRYKWFDKKGIDLYSGTGFFYEKEKWNWSGVKDELIPAKPEDIFREQWRWNNYLKFAFKVSENFDLTATTFLQFPLSSNFKQPRWYFEINNYFKISNHINFVFRWDHILDKNTVVPIENFYYGFSTGIQVNY